MTKMSQYDVIVVGGGMAGLVCSNFLARYGKRVLLLEQNHQVGGNMSGFWRKGFYFDGGDQSFESMGVVFPILEELGICTAADFHKARYRMVSGDFDFFVDTVDGAEEALRAAFPNETGLKDVFDEVRRVSTFLERNYVPENIPVLNNPSLGHFARLLPWAPRLLKWTRFSYRERVCSAVKDPGLRNWLTNIGYYKMPFLFFAGFWHIWAHDYWYPKGGMQHMLNLLGESPAEHGGTVQCNTRVSKINIVDGTARGVVLADGTRIDADQVVYAGDYKRFVGGLVPEEHFSGRFLKQIRESRLTEEILSVYLGVNRRPEELREQLQGNHVFFFPNYDVVFPDPSHDRDVHRRMWVAVNEFSEAHPESAPEGKATLTIQTYSSYDWEDRWHNGSGGTPRTEEYRRFKRDTAHQLVETAENVLPGLSQDIEYFDAGTPLSAEHFTMNTNGSTGGWCYHDKVSPVFKRWSLNMFKTPIRKLTATGHYTLWPGGVISAALSGRLVANIVAGKGALTPLEVTRARSATFGRD
ncbi:MAG: phytoene desaturase family protein [Spirochaetota bacterium]